MPVISPDLSPESSSKESKSPSKMEEVSTQICTAEPHRRSSSLLRPLYVHNPEDWERYLKQGIVNIAELGLSEVPASLFQLSAAPISILYLSYNKLRQLPSSFFDELPSLAWIDLRNNGLQVLPGLSKPHRHLRVLIVENNDLKYLPRSLVFAEILRSIHFRGNPLIDPPMAVRMGGTRAILDYLKSTLYETEGNLSHNCHNGSAPRKETPKLLSAIIDHMSKKARPGSPIATRLSSQMPTLEKFTECAKAPTKPDRLDFIHTRDELNKKYSWELWKDIPFDGIHLHRVMNEAREDMKKEILKKFNMGTDSVLQKARNKNALQKWRTKARLQTGNISEVKYNPPPFATDIDPIDDPNPENTKMFIGTAAMSPIEFMEEIKTCVDKLAELKTNSFSGGSLSQLQKNIYEMENVQRKLKGLRSNMKTPYPT